MTKYCYGCGQDKSEQEFQVPTDWGGIRIRNWCHDCCNARVSSGISAEEKASMESVAENLQTLVDEQRQSTT